MREYESVDDGLEPTDFDGFYDIPAKTAKGVAARIYFKIERDPKRAAILENRQNDAIIGLLRWIHDNREQLATDGVIPPDTDQK